VQMYMHIRDPSAVSSIFKALEVTTVHTRGSKCHFLCRVSGCKRVGSGTRLGPVSHIKSWQVIPNSLGTHKS
jgi:hypothetical protein